jgi:phosphate-selective porin OprO/OprP
VLIALLTGLLALAPAPPAQAPESTGTTTPPATGQQGDPEPRPTGVRFVWNDHPSLRVGSLFRIDFLGKFQGDGRWPGDDPLSFESMELQRARVGVEGVVLRHFRFNLEYELTEREVEVSRTSKAWKDVYFEVDYSDMARVRVGKFKVPFGLDQLTGISNLDFVYRSLGATSLAPARDIGVMVFGRVLGEKLDYSGGVFRQDGENARSARIQGADKTGAARVTIAPFRRPGSSLLDQLEIGSAVAVSALSGASELPNGLRGRTMLSRYVFFEPVFVNGQRRRFEVDADWTWESVGLRSEYTLVHDSRTRQGLGDDDLPTARARAWYVSGAYVLTGERKNRPVEPRRAFARGGIGAVEVVGRYERLWFDGTGGRDVPFRHPRAETILPSGDRAATVGVNWYANRWVKLQFQGVREQLEDPERSPLLDNASFWSTMIRLQVAL